MYLLWIRTTEIEFETRAYKFDALNTDAQAGQDKAIVG